MNLFVTIMRKKSDNQSLGLLALCLLMATQGCMAAPVAYPVLVGAQYALHGWHCYKVVQMSTGGSAEVRFQDTKLPVEDQKALSSVECLAVYPEGEKNVKLAEALSKSGVCDVITPYSVQETLPDTFRFVAFERMTEQEQIQYACKVCDTLKADSVLVYSEKGRGFEQKSYFSPKRSESTTKFDVKVFSSKHEKIIWMQEGKIVWKLGRKIPPQDEIDQVAVSAIAEKFLSDSGQK